ncbi:MAG TPA: HD domain-containing phosphohydrolase [Verrucomicrobiae bacterium]|nr:HD domain-containing phosphohydrolase [Verrucomicrobiae bacterium]
MISQSRESRGVLTGAAGVHVLCVDDEPIVLRLMSRLLERLGVEVTTATGPAEALAVFEAERFDLVVTDIRMPGMDGNAFLSEIRARDPEVPVVVATGHASLDNAIRALRDGASGMLMKPFTGEEFQAEVRAALERSRIRRAALQYTYVTPILDGVALALTAAIEARDLETGEHCQQLGFMGERVAILMGLPELARTTIRIGGYLHDVGKIAIADRILLKPGKLTVEEYAEMQRHAEIGGDIVSTHVSMADIAAIVRHHHERFDGHGYPDRLGGAAIPLGARIISVADALSAQTTDRPYRKAIPLDEAWAEIERHSGSQFDPEIVDLFSTLIGTAIVPAGPDAVGTTIRVEAVGGAATTSSGSTPEPSGLADDEAAPAVAR